MLKSNRTPTNRRYYTYNQYLQFKGIQTEDDIRDVVIYARVSTRNQKEDLENQKNFWNNSVMEEELLLINV